MAEGKIRPLIAGAVEAAAEAETRLHHRMIKLEGMLLDAQARLETLERRAGHQTPGEGQNAPAGSPSGSDANG